MKPYYFKNKITIYHADALELIHELDWMNQQHAIVTGPPWYENKEVAHELIADPGDAIEIICQWSELFHPPHPHTLVGIYAWCHSSPGRFQPFYHFAADSQPRQSDNIVRMRVDQHHPEYAGHPHQYPVGVAEWLIKKTANLPVLDPFCGAGATLIAARKLGREAIGIELDERYAEMAAKRLEEDQLTSRA